MRKPTYEELEQQLEDQSLKGNAFEDVHHALMESTGDSIYIVDRECRYRFLNSEHLRRGKWPKEQVIGKPYADFHTPEATEEFVKKIKEVLATGHSIQHEYRSSKDGRYFLRSFTAVKDQRSGSMTGVVVVAKDISAIKQTEEKLFENEELYRAIFENKGSATCIFSDDATISLVNEEFEKLTGYTREEIEGKKKWTDYVVKDDLEKMLTQHRLRTDDPAAAIKKYEFSLINKAGETRDILLCVDVIKGTKKRVASLTDITEHKRMDERLIALNKELEKTNMDLQAAYQYMRASRDCLKQRLYKEGIGFMVDRDGRIEWLSETALACINKSRIGLIGSNMLDLIQSECHAEFLKALKQAWTGTIYPLSVRCALDRETDIIMDVSFMRVSSLHTRRLWVTLDYPAEAACTKHD